MPCRGICESLANGKPISELIGARLGNTLFLAGMTAAFAIPFAVSQNSVRSVSQFVV